MNPFSQFFTSTDYLTIIPAVQLALFGCAILLFDAFEDFLFGGPQHRKRLVFGVLAAEVFAGMGLVKQQMHLGPDGLISGFGGSVTVDGFGIFFNWIFLIAAVIVAVVSYKYLEIAGEHHGEYYSLVLFAQSGMYFLATGTDLVTLFIGLELMALCFYVMVGFLRTDKRSNEAAMKYLLLGAFSTGLLVYGFSVMYGLAGSTKLAIIANRLAALPAWDPIVFLAMATTAAGLLFKISAAPFHMWAPDAYEGAPTTVTAMTTPDVEGRFRRAPPGSQCWRWSRWPLSPSAIWPPSTRLISSACSHTARSRTPVTCCWAWSPATKPASPASRFT